MNQYRRDLVNNAGAAAAMPSPYDIQRDIQQYLLQHPNQQHKQLCSHRYGTGPPEDRRAVRTKRDAKAKQRHQSGLENTLACLPDAEDPPF